MSTEPTEPLAAVAGDEHVVTQVVADPDPDPAGLGVGEPPSAPHPGAETRPELLVGGAFLGGMILAKLLGRRRG